MTILLLLTRDEVRTKLATQMDRGRTELLNAPIGNREQLNERERSVTRWVEYTAELLRQLFNDNEPADYFSEPIGHVWIGGGSDSESVRDLLDDVQVFLNRLQSIIDRVELYKEDPSVAVGPIPPASGSGVAPRGTAVFIVHGHAGRQHEVALCVTKLGLDAVILQERLHRGSSTLIEKLEREAEPCGFAIVIYTGDDEGREVGATELTLRARENVVLELGYFIGKLGRDNVTILHDEAVKVPSDFQGVGYYPLDAGGGWKANVEGELRLAKLLPPT